MHEDDLHPDHPPDVCRNMAGTTTSQTAGGNSWPVCSRVSRRATRISFSSAIAWPRRNTGSSEPWTTSVGTPISPSLLRKGSPTSMTKCFIWLDAMLTVRSTSRPTRSRMAASSKWSEPPGKQPQQVDDVVDDGLPIRPVASPRPADVGEELLRHGRKVGATGARRDKGE